MTVFDASVAGLVPGERDVNLVKVDPVAVDRIKGPRRQGQTQLVDEHLLRDDDVVHAAVIVTGGNLIFHESLVQPKRANDIVNLKRWLRLRTAFFCARTPTVEALEADRSFSAATIFADILWITMLAAPSLSKFAANTDSECLLFELGHELVDDVLFFFGSERVPSCSLGCCPRYRCPALPSSTPTWTRLPASTGESPSP